MSKSIVMFLGRNTDNIFKDVISEGLAVIDDMFIVVTRDGDKFDGPAFEHSRVEVSNFTVPAGDIIIIGNGGTTAQLVPVLKKIWDSGSQSEVWDLQRDGKRRLA